MSRWSIPARCLLGALLLGGLGSMYAGLPGKAPVDYLLDTLAGRRLVILGEFHWIRQDAQLVAALVPRLVDAGVHTLAMEVLPAALQPRIDRLITASTWDRAEAIAVLRAGEWPYVEYLEILQAVWSANQLRPTNAPKLRLLALSPGPDWRAELLPQGRTYDTFMADRVLEALSKGGRALVYCGLNHGWTAYHQPEMPRAGRVEAFLDRMGNRLRRRLGEEAFLVMLHRPWQRRSGTAWTYVLPLDGWIDCAADGGPARGFDLAACPWAEALIGADFYFGMGYRRLRLMDLADGYIWTGPIESNRLVGLIPLAEFAPDAAALAEVAAHNPFEDRPGMDRPALQKLWDAEAAHQGDFLKKFRMEGLREWRRGCTRQP